MLPLQSLRNDSAFVLVAALILLSLLMVVGTGALVAVRSDYRISSNLNAAAGAFYAADSGIEWAKSEISRAAANPPILASRTVSFVRGSSTVTFVTTVRRTALSAAIVIRSIGTLGLASQIVEAQIGKTYDLTDAALVLRGNSRGVNFGSDAFFASGVDFDPAAAVSSSGKGRFGISVDSDAIQSQVESSLTDSQKSRVTSASANIRGSEQSAALPAENVARLADGLCSSAAVQTITVSAGSMSLPDQNWGTRAAPQLRCIQGAGDGGAIVFQSLSGAGIIIVRDVELVLSGPFHWEGLIMVTGRHIGFRVEGTESKAIYGGIIVNETGSASDTGPLLLDIRGALTVAFSRSAFRNTAPLIPPDVLQTTYAALPSFLTQDYWRAVSP